MDELSSTPMKKCENIIQISRITNHIYRKEVIVWKSRYVEEQYASTSLEYDVKLSGNERFNERMSYKHGIKRIGRFLLPKIILHPSYPVKYD